MSRRRATWLNDEGFYKNAREKRAKEAEVTTAKEGKKAAKLQVDREAQEIRLAKLRGRVEKMTKSALAALPAAQASRALVAFCVKSPKVGFSCASVMRNFSAMEPLPLSKADISRQSAKEKMPVQKRCQGGPAQVGSL